MPGKHLYLLHREQVSKCLKVQLSSSATMVGTYQVFVGKCPDSIVLSQFSSERIKK